MRLYEYVLYWQGVEEDEDEDVEPFVLQARGMEDLTGDGGVKKRVLQQGTGDVVCSEIGVPMDLNV